MATVMVLYAPRRSGSPGSPDAGRTRGRGVRALRVWVSAPQQVPLQRLADRTTARRVPVSAQEASWIYDQATLQAAGRRLDTGIDTGEQQDRASVVAVLRPLLDHR